MRVSVKIHFGVWGPRGVFGVLRVFECRGFGVSEVRSASCNLEAASLREGMSETSPRFFGGTGLGALVSTLLWRSRSKKVDPPLWRTAFSASASRKAYDDMTTLGTCDIMPHDGRLVRKKRQNRKEIMDIFASGLHARSVLDGFEHRMVSASTSSCSRPVARRCGQVKESR